MLKQFKLTNDEEIVCEIVQWPEDADEPVIIKKVLKINSSDNYLSGTKYYSLRHCFEIEKLKLSNLYI